MTRRFLAILWHPSDTSMRFAPRKRTRYQGYEAGVTDEHEPGVVPAALHLACAIGMTEVLRTACMLVLVQDIDVTALHSTSDSSGVVLGDIYYRHRPSGAFDGSPLEVERLLRICREGRLDDECWGSFLMLRQDNAGAVLEAYHSALSSLPVYHAEAQGAVLIASDADLLRTLVDEPPGIDWLGIAMQLGSDDIAFRRTGVMGIGELRCGEVLQLQHDHQPEVRRTWNPWRHAAPDNLLDDRGEALARLERELLRCISLRVRGLSMPLLDLSGGFDSSLLAALTSTNGVDVHAVNMFSPATEGDERGFARSVAKHLGIALAECAPEADRIDVRHCPSPHLPRPHARSFVQEIDRQTRIAAPQANAFINGGGGDAVFCHLQSSGPAADVLRAQGSPLAFLRTVHAIATAAQVSFWVALRLALAKAARPGHTVKLVESANFLAKEAIVRPLPADLPWPPPPRHILPGKLQHVRAIYSSCFNMQGFARSGSMKPVFPMLSQPLVETCLQIPTWMWLGQGHDRILARTVAANWLPPQVAWRRSKGGLGQLQRDIYRLHKGAISEMLLEGVLQKQGLLDRRAIEAQFAPASELTSDQFPRLLRLCDFEAWARHWT